MKRCGKIELMRFVFAVFIMLCRLGTRTHINDNPLFVFGGLNFTLFKYVGICVEFFFLVSGFLMAKTAFKMNSNPELCVKPLGTETTVFVWRKLKPLLPYSIFFCALIVVVISIGTQGKGLMENIISSAGSVFFLQRTGLTTGSAFIDPAWYISSMLIAMLILYPLCRKFYNMFTHVIAPILAMLCLGYLLFTYKSLEGVMLWSVVTFRCNIRAIGVISLGAVCFEFYRFMTSKQFGRGMSILLTIIECL